jgi:hypothetical protein
VRFVDFLKTTVLLSAAAATALAVLTVLKVAAGTDPSSVLIPIGWWVLATLIGLRLGRRSQISSAIAGLLAGAKSTMAIPEQRPGVILLNRLWPLLTFTILAGACALLAPQIPGIGAGFAIIWALAWRRQGSAVAAIEDRDGVRFYVLPTSPVRPIKLQRTPGFRTVRPPESNGAPV